MQRWSSEESKASKRRKTNVELQSVTEVVMIPGILENVLLFLDITSIAQSLQMYSNTWKNSYYRETLWKNLCARLWHRKVYVPAVFRDMANTGRAAEAYKGSNEDSRRRIPSLQEVCQFAWAVRKSNPGWCYQGVSNRCYFMDKTSRSYDGFNESVLKRTRWKLKVQDGDAFILHSRDGIDVATLKVYRDPGNWGFVAQSGSYFTTSFPMPLYGQDPGLEQLARRWRGHSIEYSTPGHEF